MKYTCLLLMACSILCGPIGKSEYIDQSKQENESFGIFVRTLVGLNREVAKGLLYESPFMDVAPQGPEAIFTAEQIQRIIRLLDDIKLTAIAA